MAEVDDTACLSGILATAVGSMPHTNPDEAVDLIVSTLNKAVHAPQLSQADPREQMWIQFTEGLPRFRVDLERLSYYFDTSGDPISDVEEFYTHYFDVVAGGPADHFAVGPEYGRGIHCLLALLRKEGVKRPFIKVQVTGPLSFGMTVTDESKRPIFYHPLFRDVAVKGMGLKAAWLLDQFKPFAEQVIVFFDEPSLSAYGSSAFLGVSREDVTDSLDDVIGMVTQRGGIAGIHCCGNTDWGILMSTSAQIVNFDAVDYMETIAIYSRELPVFLARGGVLAWGAVRNTEVVLGETVDDVIRRVRNGLRLLENNGVDTAALKNKMILTPACGCAGLSLEATKKVYAILSQLDSKAREEILGA